MTAMKLGPLAWLLAPAMVACHSLPPYDYAREPDPRTSEFEIGPLDQLSIEVWKNKDLSAVVTVRPDGIVTLPLIGDVKAAGRKPSSLQKELERRYADFIRAQGETPTVSVAVSQVNSYSFTVSGNVEKAGLYAPRAYVTTVEAVAMAGGPNKFAGDEVYVVRQGRRIPIDLPRATSGERPEQNIVILRGDVVMVP